MFDGIVGWVRDLLGLNNGSSGSKSDGDGFGGSGGSKVKTATKTQKNGGTGSNQLSKGGSSDSSPGFWQPGDDVEVPSRSTSESVSDNAVSALSGSESLPSVAEVKKAADERGPIEADKAEKSDLAPSFEPSDTVAGKLDSLSGGAQTTSDTNQVYESLYSGEGYDKDADQDNWWDHIAKGVFNLAGFAAPTAPSYTEDGELRAEPVEMEDPGEELGKAVDRFHDAALDDGTLNAGNLTSNWVTGEQLAKQQAAGVPLDMSADEIDPDEVYSKRDLQLYHGYQPYTPDAGSYWKMVASNLASAPAEAAAAVRNSRENLTDYTITIDGRSIKENDYDLDASREWLDKVNEEFNDDPVLTTADGAVEYHPKTNSLALDDDGKLVSDYDDDGNLRLYLEDGTYWTFTGDNKQTPAEEAQSYVNDLYKAVNNDGAELWKSSLDDQVYTSPSGERFSYSEVSRIANDTISSEAGGGNYEGDDGISYDFGKFNIAKPASAMTEEITLDNIAPQFWDILASSAPYFAKQVAIPVALSNAYMESRNINPNQIDKDGSLRQSAADIDDDTKRQLESAGYDPDKYEDYYKNGAYGEKVLADALMPLTEFGLGNIGKSALKMAKPVKKWLEKHPVADYVTGTVGEGIEEIPGNVMEEATNSGFTKSWYEDYLRDDDGNILRDTVGNPLKAQTDNRFLDINTGGGDGGVVDGNRAGNFADDAPGAFEGGALLGGVLGLPGLAFGVSRNKLRKAKDIENSDPNYTRWYSEYSNRE